MDVELYSYIKSAQVGNKDAMLFLIDKFNPLIKKYAYLLKEDDAVQSFTLVFIETIHKIKLSGFDKTNAEYPILNYIKRSIKNSYYIYSKKRSNNLNNTLEFKEDINVPYLNKDINLSIEINEAMKALTLLQKTVITYKFYYGYTDVEIAKNLSVSRQAVNRIKNRAMLKLK